MQALIGEAGRRGGRWSSRRGEGSEAGERTGGLEEAEGERERSEMAGSRVSTIRGSRLSSTSRLSSIGISIMLMLTRVDALLEEDCVQVTI